MDHLVFKPLRIVEPTYSVGATPDPVEKIGDEHLIVTHWMKSSAGDEACDTFLLSDIVEGETVLAGYTTRGCFEVGVVKDYRMGWYFNFDGVNDGSRLWNGLLLLRGPLADLARARYKARIDYARDGTGAAPPMKRTDSGGNYGVTGYPDLEFWTRSGCQPWLYVMSEDYNERDENVAEVGARVQQMRQHAATADLTPLQRKALEHQIGKLSAMITPAALGLALFSPPAAVSEVPVQQGWSSGRFGSALFWAGAEGER